MHCNMTTYNATLQSVTAHIAVRTLDGCGVNIGGQKMGVDLDKNDPQKNQPIDDGTDFGNAGAPSQAAPKSKELSNPFEGNGAPDGGAYGGNQV